MKSARFHGGATGDISHYLTKWFEGSLKRGHIVMETQGLNQWKRLEEVDAFLSSKIN